MSVKKLTCVLLVLAAVATVVVAADPTIKEIMTKAIVFGSIIACV
jgi:hypothetical protein